MKPTLGPGWLVSLCCQLAKRELAVQDRGLGYPRKACGFSEKTTGGFDHSDPVAFQARDFADLQTALDTLREANIGQFMAAMMYYRPWNVRALRAVGWPYGSSTYYARLHGAHAALVVLMRRDQPTQSWSRPGELLAA